METKTVYTEKYCGMCKETKPITDFYKSKRYIKYGVKPNCKKCYCMMARKCNKKRYHQKKEQKKEQEKEQNNCVQKTTNKDL